jgi:1-phosphofructokinase family hexose kinase
MAPRIFTITPNPNIDRTLTVPELRLNEVLRSIDIRLDAGGKGLNVARALHALGSACTAVAFFGGPTGEQESAMLRALGIHLRVVPIRDETRSCHVVTDPDGAKHVKVNEPGPVVTAAEQAALLRLVEQEARAGDLWVAAGSLPRGVPADFYRQIVELVQARRGRAVLDASGPALAEGLEAHPFLIKPNGDEVAQITGQAVATPQEAAAAMPLLLRHAATVAISLGAAGLVLGSDEGVLHAAPPAIVARNAVGAGDAAVAGMLYALAREWPLDEVARWGAACGTAAAMRPGVDFGAYAEVEEVAARVVVRPLA